MALSLISQGFNYVSYYNGGYENADSLAALAATGANALSLETEYGIDVGSSQIYSDNNYTDSLQALGNTIDEAKSLGLSVMVRPLIDFLDPSKIGANAVGDFRSYFNPTDPTAFFASYKSMIVAEAQVAQAHGADSLCIGVEIDQLTGPQYLADWTDIITAVRAVFSGKLTYSADWNDAASPWAGHNGLGAGTGNLATQVSFWNQLDSVGIDAYPALSDAPDPSEADLVAGWTQVPTDAGTRAVTGAQSLISYFESVAAQVGKPLLLTELGYENASDAASQPAGSSSNQADPTLQANLYQAFFDAWGQAGNGALNGVYFWNWDPNTAEVGPGNGVSFSPQGQPAQSIIEENFAASTAAGGAPATGTTPPVLAFDPSVVFASPNRVTLSGTASDPNGVASVEVFEGDVALGLATLGDGGTWTATLDLPAGFHTGLSAVGTDGAGNVSAHVASDFDLTTGIHDQGTRATIDNYAADGTYLGTTDFGASGQIRLQTGYEALANGDQRYSSIAGSILKSRGLTSYADTFNANGDLVWEQQKVIVGGRHTLTGAGAHDTFVFQADFGQDTIVDFNAVGTAHDVLSLPKSEFSSLAQVLRHAVQHGDTTQLTADNGDRITLQNVAIGDLQAKDFKYVA